MLLNRHLAEAVEGASTGDCHGPAYSSGAASNRLGINQTCDIYILYMYNYIYIYLSCRVILIVIIESQEIIRVPSSTSVSKFCCAQLCTFTQSAWKHLLRAGSLGFTIYQPQSIGRAAKGWHSQQGSTNQHTLFWLGHVGMFIWIGSHSLQGLATVFGNVWNNGPQAVLGCAKQH